MEEILQKIKTFVTLGAFSAFKPTTILEIIIIAFLIYNVLMWIKNTRAWALFKGIIVVSSFALIAYALHLNTILWIFEKTFNVLVICVFIVFQPELRRALEQLGRKNFIVAMFASNVSETKEKRNSERSINEVIKAAFEMSKVKTGALIVLERDVVLNEYERTGIPLDSIVSAQLLVNIFEHNTPLHDGAVFIRNNRIVAATCYLPLSDNMELSKELGTRHRAAVGISEVSDSMTIIVSEETGAVSLAMDGKLVRNLTPETLKKLVCKSLPGNEEPGKLNKLKGIIRNEKKLLNNLGMKLISVLAAIVIWLIIVNIDDAYTTKTIVLPVQEINAEDLRSLGQTYEVVSGSVATVKIRGRASSLLYLDASDFVATADLSNLSATGAVWVDIKPKENVKGIEILGNNNVYKVVTENLMTNQYSVKVRTKGDVANGYYLGEVKVTPNLVSITGSETKITNIKEVVVEVDVNGYSSNITKQGLQPVVYALNGDAMDTSRLQMDVSTVDVSITMLRTKTVPVEIEYIGEPAEGYVVVSREAALNDIKIAGSKADLDKISSIKLKCDISGINEKYENTILYKDFLPENIYLTEGDAETSGVAVSVVAEPVVEKEIAVPFSGIALKNQSDLYDYSLENNQSEIEVSVVGAESVVNALTSSSLKISVDVNQLKEGIHILPLTIYTSGGQGETYTVKENQKMTINIKRKSK